MNTNLDFLFKELFLTKRKYDYKYEKEEKFNIFSVLYKWHDEVKLHSRFLSALLNPAGSHKKGSIFLKLFLENQSVDLGSLDKVEVFPDEIHKSEYQNIDILVINRAERKALMIENKIFAGDSNNDESGQLERYFDLLLDEGIPKDNLHVRYLTIDGRSPSEESLGRYGDLENMNGKAISYGVEIEEWIGQCMKECLGSPFLRESVFQYHKLIQSMTGNQSDIEHRKELIEVISRSNENLQAAKQLFDNFKHIKWHTIADFWYELAEQLKANNFEILETPSEYSITQLTHHDRNRRGQEPFLTFRIEEGFIMHISFVTDEWLYFGSFEEEVTSSKVRTKIQSLLKKDDLYKQVSPWLFWKFFFEDDTERIYLTDFSHPGTFNLIDRGYREQVITKMVQEIKLFLEKLNAV